MTSNQPKTLTMAPGKRAILIAQSWLSAIQDNADSPLNCKLRMPLLKQFVILHHNTTDSD